MACAINVFFRAQGCGISSSESLGFLRKLVKLARIKDGSQSLAVHDTGPPTATQGVNEGLNLADNQGMVPPKQPGSLAHAKLLEFACANFPQLTSEICQALPSDISKASAKHRSVCQTDVAVRIRVRLVKRPFLFLHCCYNHMICFPVLFFLRSVFVDDLLGSCQDRIDAFSKINESISLQAQGLSKLV